MKESKQLEMATFAGGCFWCTEAVFKRLKGVLSVTSGYAGGSTQNPSYEALHSGTTGHAEAIQVEFNPTLISYDDLLEIFWHLHNPTTLNQQGADIGTEYRSLILYHNEEQKEKAVKSKEKIEKEKLYDKPIVTDIVPFQNFYKAESYHQNYYDSNKSAPYCRVVIDPKIQKLLKEFNDKVKDEYK